MIKIEIYLPLLFLLIFSNFGILQGQNFKCDVLPIDAKNATGVITNYDVNLNFSTEEYCGFSEIGTLDRTQDISKLFVDVVFHFVGNDDGINFHCDLNGDDDLYAPTIVSRLLFEANKKFGVLSPSIPGRVHDTRIRYSNPSTVDNPCNGLFFYDEGTPISYVEGKMNLVFLDRPQDGPCSVNGATNIGLNRIFLYNMLKAITTPCISGGVIQQYNFARTISHELGHVFGLPHAFSCHNSCIGIDMDITEECADSGDETYCDPSFGQSPGQDHCQGMGASKNFMGFNNPKSVITPCQLGLMLQYIVDNKPNFVRLCDNYLSPRLINDDEVWNDFVRIMDRDIIVETGSTLTINCEVYMGEDKRITVQRGAKLLVDGGKISNLCDDTFWEGIVVHGNASQEQPNLYDILEPDDAGIVHIKDSRIEYANRAIRASGSGFANYDEQVARWGGLIVAENSHFTNNKVSAGFMKYDFSNKSRFINCTFEHLLNLDYSNSYGVSIWACHDILFEGNIFTNLSAAGIEGISFSAKILTGYLLFGFAHLLLSQVLIQ